MEDRPHTPSEPFIVIVARKKYGKRRYRRRKKKTSVGKALLRDAKKRGTNSLLEKAVKIIAVREAKKLIPPNLLFRRYYYQDYDGISHRFGVPTDLDMEGVLVHVVQIPLNDASTMVAVPPLSDLDMRPQIPLYPRGDNTIAVSVPQIGYRSSNTISIKSVSAQMIFRMAQEEEPDEARVLITYALVATSNTAQYGLQWYPPVNQILPWKQWGYSSRIDVEARDDSALFKYRTLAKGSCYISASPDRPREIRRTLFKKLNMPYEYHPMGQNGQRVTGVYKLWLVARARLFAGTEAQPTQKPTIAAVCKVAFKNIT